MSEPVQEYDPLGEARRIAGANRLFIVNDSRPVKDSYPTRYAPCWKLYRRALYHGGRATLIGERGDPVELLRLVKRCAGIK